MICHGKPYFFHNPKMYHTHAQYIVIILYKHKVVPSNLKLYVTISTIMTDTEIVPGNDVTRPTALSVAVAVTVVVGTIILIIITALLILSVYRHIGHTCHGHVR